MTYLDHNASSPLRPEARAAMERAFGVTGNPSSIHLEGRVARAMIEDAREKVAALTGARPQDVIFTSGGTEANALGLWGAVQAAAEAEMRITRIFVSAIEHDSVLAAACALGERHPGVRVANIPVTSDGVIDTSALEDLLREGKGRVLVAVMAANNETGVIQPIDTIADLVRAYGGLLHVDSVQACGKIAVDAGMADYTAISAHKIGGPQGIGALILNDDAPIAAQVLGGGQERGRRAGTENIIGIAGFGAAAGAVQGDDTSSIQALRDRFEDHLGARHSDVVIFGYGAQRVCNTSNFSLPHLTAETAVMALDLDGVMASSGSACSSGKVGPSHVLKAMGVSDEHARSALRISFGWSSTEADVDSALEALGRISARRRAPAAA